MAKQSWSVGTGSLTLSMLCTKPFLCRIILIPLHVFSYQDSSVDSKSDLPLPLVGVIL